MRKKSTQEPARAKKTAEPKKITSQKKAVTTKRVAIAKKQTQTRSSESLPGNIECLAIETHKVILPKHEIYLKANRSSLKAYFTDAAVVDVTIMESLGNITIDLFRHGNGILHIQNTEVGYLNAVLSNVQSGDKIRIHVTTASNHIIARISKKTDFKTPAQLRPNEDNDFFIQ